MAEYVIKLPDVGEGIAEAELVEWHVKVGDLVREDAPLAAVMTDKATVEIPSPVDGEVLWVGGEVGDVMAVGSELLRLKVAGETADAPGGRADAPQGEGTPAGARAEKAEKQGAAAGRGAAETTTPVAAGTETAPMRAAASPSPAFASPAPPSLAPSSLAASSLAPSSSAPSSLAPSSREPVSLAPTRPVPARQPVPATRSGGGAPRPEGEKPLAAPAVRLRAREAGIDLRQVPGSGPAGRIMHEDLDGFLARGTGAAGTPAPAVKTAVQDVKVTGLRRRIAERMAIANTRIPHITYVEEVDVTALETLRTTLNSQKQPEQPRLTLLPFLMCAVVRAVADQPNLNALYDDEANVVHQHAAVHIGIATQTPAGLMVPVVKHVEALDLWACATALNRLADAARDGTASREELTGSTITITSLGAMGGLVSTPIINHPEVAIIGVNKIVMRPVWDGATFVPRRMMNLSSSFDHRVVDGWDAARFVQRIRTLLETPAMIFIHG